MGIRIKYWTDEAGKERFRISGMNGEPMAWGEAYESGESAAHAVQVIAEAFKTGDVVIDEGPAMEAPPPDDEETGDEHHVELPIDPSDQDLASEEEQHVEAVDNAQVEE